MREGMFVFGLFLIRFCIDLGAYGSGVWGRNEVHTYEADTVNLSSFARPLHCLSLSFSLTHSSLSHFPTLSRAITRLRQCEKAYHMSCLTPPLSSIPEEEWFCPSCQKEGEDPMFVQSLPGSLSLDSSAKKRKADGGEETVGECHL